MRRARRIAVLACVALCAAAGLAYAGVKTGVLPLAGSTRAKHHVPIIRVRLAPSTVSVTAPATVRMRVSITGRGWPRTGGVPARSSAVHVARSPVRLTLRVPRGITATFGPKVTATRRATLTLRVATGSRPGRYRLRVVATRVRGRHSHARVRRAFRTLVLTVRPGATGGSGSTPVAVPPTTTPGPSSAPAPDTRRLLIGGNLSAALTPGAVQPLDAKLGNPFDEPLDVTSIELTAVRINAPAATPALPCDSSDFALQPLTGPPVRVGAGVVASLADLGVPRERWPAITMLDRPANQNGCKGAVVTFSYRAVAGSTSP
ncbi:MAG TPA: hypothetical protein VII98_07165 [Solirubrobacteraceae bacterium]